MTDILLQLRSNKPGASTLTLVNGSTATGYRMLTQPAWGNAAWDIVYSGPRGTQGARAVGGTPLQRGVAFAIRVEGASKDTLVSALSALQVVCDEMRRYGGRITWRSRNESYRQHFDVLAGSATVKEWTRTAEHTNLLDVVVEAVCAPYLLGDPMGWRDTFDDAATLTDNYTVTGASSLSVLGGKLGPSGSNPITATFTAYGYQLRDAQVTLKVETAGGVTSAQWHVTMAGGSIAFALSAADNTLGVRVNGSAAATAAYTPLASTRYWLRGRRVGRRLTAELFTSEPTPNATPAATVSYVLTADEDALYPAGLAGFKVTAFSTSERYDDFTIEPFTFAGLTLPDAFRLGESIPGDAPALVDVNVTPSGGSAAPAFGMLGWTERPAIANLCPNGDFEDDVDGWSVAAVSGVTGAATSITRTTTASRVKYGSAAAAIVCPATANTGATYFLPYRFKAGRRYTLVIWAYGSAMTASRVRLGVSGDIASSSALALETQTFADTPNSAGHVRTVTWTPAADTDGAYACIEITAATATTIYIDAVSVFEARDTTLSATLTAAATTASVRRVPDDWPEAPFMALIDREVVQVSSISGTTLTIVRGIEGGLGTAGISGSSYAAGTTVIPLPQLRGHFEGKGAPPVFGFIDAGGADSSNLYTWALTSSGSYRLGNYLYASGLSGAGSAAADWLIDPNLLQPDDYTQGEVAVEVWARMVLHSGLTAPTAILAAAPETATVSSGVLANSFGQVRYSEEHGSTGRAPTKPSSGEAVRMVRLGTLRLPTDRTRPIRWRLQVRLTWTAATAATAGIDYLVVAPARQRAASPTYKALGSSYPKFVSSTSETTKTVRSDLSAVVGKPASAGVGQPDHGLGGALIELPVPCSDAFLKLSSLVPDDPTSDTTTEQLAHTAVVRFDVTPRYMLARGSDT